MSSDIAVTLSIVALSIAGAFLFSPWLLALGAAAVLVEALG